MKNIFEFIIKYFIYAYILFFTSSIFAQQPTPSPDDENDQPPSRNFIYRTDFRDPEDIFHNGFTSRGTDTNIIRHVFGMTPYGQGRGPQDQTAYVAATGHRERAAGIAYSNNVARARTGSGANTEGPVTLYIYEIRGADRWSSVRPALTRYVDRYIERNDISQAQRGNALMRLWNELDTEEWVAREVPANTIHQAWRVTYHYPNQEYIEPNWNEPIVNDNFVDEETQTSSQPVNEYGEVDTPLTVFLSSLRGASAAFSACCCGRNSSSSRSLLIDWRNDNSESSHEKYCENPNHYLSLFEFPQKYEDKFTITFGKEVDSTGLNFGDRNRQWVDFDGDGMEDHCALGNSREGKFAVLCAMQKTGGKFEMLTITDVKDFGWPNLRYWMDVNGDGKTDYCRMVYWWTRLRCSLSNGTGFSRDIESVYLDQGFWQMPADINGDNAVDFCRLLELNHEIVMRCLLGVAGTTGGFGQDTFYRDVGPQGLGDADYGWPDSRIWADVNGDGKADFCRLIETNTQLRCNIMQGLGSDNWKRVDSEVGIGAPSTDLKWWVNYDGDIRQSFCVKLETHDTDADVMACTALNKDDSSFKTTEYKFKPSFKTGFNSQWVHLSEFPLMSVCFQRFNDDRMGCSQFDGKKFDDFTPFPSGTSLGYGDFTNGNRQIVNNIDGNSYFCRNEGAGKMRCLQIKLSYDAKSDVDSRRRLKRETHVNIH